MRPITNIVVHCSATPDNPNHPAYNTTMQDITRWHTSPPNNWNNNGYHEGIERDGSFHEGRPIYLPGAHCKAKGKNSDSIGICLIGTSKFTPEQLNTLAVRILYYQSIYGPELIVAGHCDYESKKTCPNFNVGLWWERLQSTIHHLPKSSKKENESWVS